MVLEQHCSISTISSQLNNQAMQKKKTIK